MNKLSSTLLQATIHNCLVAKKIAFVYVIHSKDFRCIYIGQTRSVYGAIGRLAQHLSETHSNTFQQRICALNKLESVSLGRVDFAAVPLRGKKEFLSDSSDYRESVEYLVQWDLLRFVRKEGIQLQVISRVRSKYYITEEFIKQEANEVVQKLTDWLKELPSS
ncbi:MAG: hypothetical protein AB4911_06665 [Oscillochloridaceae bacterium umkhey_bin13]